MYFSFYGFVFFINIIFTFAIFTPTGRYFHSSVLVDRKLYFSGGIEFPSINSNKFFYLDVSKPFNITDDVSIPWVDLTSTSSPSKYQDTACIGGNNHDQIFVLGGLPYNQSFVIQFDSSKQLWINITSTVNVPTNRYDISCTNFNNGLIAIFSGYSSSSTIANDLWILNTLALSWSLSNGTNAPLSRFGYCAITLPNDNILYIGGSSPANLSVYMPMNNLPLYNTKSDAWTNMSISGPTPPVRRYFSAVLSMFANLTSSSRIFILDVSRKDYYKWITEFTPNTTISNNANPTSNINPANTISSSTNTVVSDFKNLGLIIGATIGGVIFLIFLVASCIVTIK
ncbi:23351_t:CDS:2, partial [Cetraspora pellucida]